MLFMANLLPNGLHEKVMICFISYITKSRLDVQFVKKTPLEKFNRWKSYFELYYLQIGFQKYLRYSLFIAYENDEWCHFVVHVAIGFYWGRHFIACVSFFSIFFFFLSFFVSSITCWSIEVSLAILKRKQWSCF